MRVNAVVNSERQSVAGRVDSIDHVIKRIKAISYNVQDGSENFTFQPMESIALEGARRKISAVFAIRRKFTFALRRAGSSLPRKSGPGMDGTK